MHKYQPRIWIIRCDDTTNAWDYYNNPASCFTFEETKFIAVTAYQVCKYSQRHTTRLQSTQLLSNVTKHRFD